MAKMYVCPMHPEVRQAKPGRCSKCGMHLVPEESNVRHPAHEDLAPVTWRSYMPLMVIVGLIVLTVLAIAWRDIRVNTFDWRTVVGHFMIGFFLVFSGFKLMDLKGFAQGYATYDLLAQRWYSYGYIYPFIELFFGLAMIINFQPRLILWFELLVMGFSGVGVAIKLLKKESFQCACLGTFLKIPLTKVTLVEDFGMALLAALMLFV